MTSYLNYHHINSVRDFSIMVCNICLHIQLISNKHKQVTFILLRCSFGPIPDNCSIGGVPIAPADKIISLLALNRRVLPSFMASTPIA